MRKTALFLLIAMLLVGINSSTVEAASNKTKLNSTKVTLTTGKTKTLKLKNYSKLNKKKLKKVKWSTSNKKVVSITKVSGKYKQNCKITAKKAGKAIIKVKHNGKTYKCTVTVKNKTNNTTEKTTTEKKTTEKSNTDKKTTEKSTEKTTTTEKTTETPTVPTTPSDIGEHDCWFHATNTHHDAEKVGEYGYTVWTCSLCNKTLDTVKDSTPKERDYTLEWITVDPTCTQNGYKAQYKIYSDDGSKEMVPNTYNVINATGHTFTYTYSEHHCPHVAVTRTATCTKCCYTETDTGIGYNHVTNSECNDYTVYIDLNNNNYDSAWQASGSYGASVMEKCCNHCKYITSSYDHYTLDILISQARAYKSNGYKLILRSNNYTDLTDGRISIINELKGLVNEDWTK